MTPARLAMLGALVAGVAVVAGAFATHALRARVGADLLGAFETGARYQMYHGLALLATAWVADRWPGPLPRAAGWCFLAGVLLFSGSLYALALSGIGMFGAVTPLGGIAFLAGWACLALAPGRHAGARMP